MVNIHNDISSSHMSLLALVHTLLNNSFYLNYNHSAIKKTFCDQFKILANIVEVYQKILLSCFLLVFKEMQTFCLLIMSAWIIIHHTKLHT